MGRGRQKAKQTKVARDLKYRTIDTDFGSLERELRSREEAANGGGFEEPDYSQVASQYGDDFDEDENLDNR